MYWFNSSIIISLFVFVFRISSFVCLFVGFFLALETVVCEEFLCFFVSYVCLFNTYLLFSCMLSLIATLSAFVFFFSSFPFSFLFIEIFFISSHGSHDYYYFFLLLLLSMHVYMYIYIDVYIIRNLS